MDYKKIIAEKLNIEGISAEELYSFIETPPTSDMGDFAAFNAVYEQYFISKPARSCVAVKTLPKGLLCEIEAIALA